MIPIKKLDRNAIIPIYEQIKNDFIFAVENKKLKVGDSIPSIHKLCEIYGLSPGTVIRAYEELKEEGIFSSKQGKGFFISSVKLEKKLKVFLLFDRMNSYKEILYESFTQYLDNEIEVNVLFHHYEKKRFDKLIRENLGKYTHYVIMPHFNQDVSKILQKIPKHKLILIDNRVNKLGKDINAVYQDFKKDIYSALKANIESLKKYNKVWLSLSKSKFQFVPSGCIEGFQDLCSEFGLNAEVTSNLQFKQINHNEVYIIFSDSELIKTIKFIDQKGWVLGKDIGVISYDDTPMKEILHGGISVLTTDFKQMGLTSAKMVNKEISGHIPNPFKLIRRSSF